VRNFIRILFATFAAIAMTAGCATAPQEQGDLCLSCGEVVQVSESDTTPGSFSNDNLVMADQTTASALASFGSVGQLGVPTRQSSMTSGPGMGLSRAEKNYDVMVRMASGERRVVRMPRSMAGRWQIGDKVKLVGNSLIRK
jgi:hypothetical protein